MKNTPERRAWLAMNKFAEDSPLTDAEWHDLGALTLIDRNQLHFGPGNARWAESEHERADNERFYRTISRPLVCTDR